MTQRKVDQNWVIVLGDGTVVGTPSGNALTRNGAWIQEREMQMFYGDRMTVKAIQLSPYTSEHGHEEASDNR